jgi:NAD(P)-dependent dehydrogenase (short-subunit alcohol dehydrogenase family)
VTRALRCAAVDLGGKVVVVTGGGSGIGAALCHEAAERGARSVVVADRDPAAAEAVTEAIAATGRAASARTVDVADADAVAELVTTTAATEGSVDVVVGNAGLTDAMGGVDLDDATWDRCLDVNVLAHVAAAAALDGAREGRPAWSVHVSSGAGLLTYVHSAPYTVTKAAVVALAEWLAIEHGDDGLGVTCVVPLSVDTPGRARSLAATGTPSQAALDARSLGPAEVAGRVLDAVAAERFLVWSDDIGLDWWRAKVTDRDRWIRGMRGVLEGRGSGSRPPVPGTTVADRVVVVTGGGSGIGRALCERFGAEGARAVVVADREADAARTVAAAVGGIAVPCDVAVEDDVRRLVATAEAEAGPVDVFCSNAGIVGAPGLPADVAPWRTAWAVNVMAHVYAARAVLPSMRARGTGWLVQTASAAGLLTQVGAAPYSVTKRAAVALGEWLAITEARHGIGVSVLAPQGVRTPMLAEAASLGAGPLLQPGALEPGAVAGAVVDGLAAGRFLVLPHPEVATFEERRAADVDRWIASMRRLRDQARAAR